MQKIDNSMIFSGKKENVYIFHFFLKTFHFIHENPNRSYDNVFKIRSLILRRCWAIPCNMSGHAIQ